MQIDMVIINAGELLTLKGPKRARRGEEMDDLSIIKNGAVAIDEGKIIDVDTTELIEQKYVSQKIINAQGKVVMPGFIDPHTHPVFVYTRENEFEMRIKGKSYVEISQTGGGIKSSIKSVREAEEKLLYDLSYKRVLRMISNGSTTIEAKSGYGLSVDSELKMLRVVKQLTDSMPVDIVSTFLGAHEIPEEYKNNREDYISLIKDEMLPLVKSNGLAEYCDIFTEAHVFNVSESRDILLRAKELGFKLKMHADEIAPIGGAELAAELEAVSADHLGAASDEGLRLMAEKGVIAVLLPGTIFSLGMTKYARARFMIDAKLPIALATDFNPGSCNCDSMQFIVTLACLNMKLTVAEAITASTINAAYSIEKGFDRGSLEPGKLADILIMDMPTYKYLPYHFGSNNVDTVIKKGKIIAKNSYGLL